MSEKSVNQDSRHRVAFDLMNTIATNEGRDRVEKPDPRTYYLTLYYQCLKATSEQYALGGVLSEDE